MPYKISIVFFLFSLSFHAQQPYYNDVDLTLTGEALYEELQDKIEVASSTFTYEMAREAIKTIDEDTQNSNNVLLVYGYDDNDNNCTTDRSRDKDDFGGLNCEWNREHVFARGNTNPVMGEVNNSTTGIGADPHNLRASDQQMNNNKGNKRFGSGSGNAGNVGSGNWYPGDEWKGDVARMIMYMYVRYGDRCLPSLQGEGTPQGSTEMLALFLQWNAEDPVNAYEDQRNPFLEGIYGNRNPFIDNPYLATLIWGGPQAEDRWNLFSVENQDQSNTVIYPNPTEGTIRILNSSSIQEVILYNQLGIQLFHKKINDQETQMHLDHLSNGIYFLKLTSGNQNSIQKIIIQK